MMKIMNCFFLILNLSVCTLCIFADWENIDNYNWKEKNLIFKLTMGRIQLSERCK